MTSTPFNPAAHPPLTDLGERLRELAGDAAYRAGRDYLRKGRVQDATVAETAAYATVKGSTEYRVTVAFPSVEATKVGCTCPAHRRNKYCKHVVAVCTALVEQPTAFSVIDALPEAPAPAKKATPRKRGAGASKTQPAELRAAGLKVLDRLLVELADGGLVQLGPEKAALIEQCAELVRALKLRRLGNLLMQLQRAVADPRALAGPDGTAAFSRLLLDLYLCRAATGAQLEGKVSLDPRLAEDLLGKTWRAEELEPISGLELVQVAATSENDGEFVVETSYLVDLASREIYAERQITPSRLRSAAPKVQHRVRLVVDEAGLYPGLPPRRIRLGKVSRAPFRVEDLDRLIAGATDDLSEIQRRLIERATVPFGQTEVAVMFRPAILLVPADGPEGTSVQSGALDASGRFARLEWGAYSVADLAASLPADRPAVVFGLARLGNDGMVLRGLDLVGATLRRASRRAGGGPPDLPF